MMDSAPRPGVLRILIALLALVGLSGVVFVALLALTEPVYVIEITPSNTGQPEYCLTCHQGIEAMSASHPTEAFGCVSCHGGEPLATREDRAHAGMVRNPAALDTAETYCGECHPRQLLTVQRSIQATYAGAIAHVRRTFGLQADDTAQYAVVEVGHLQALGVGEDDPLPMQGFAANCMDCHLHADSIEATYFYRSTGCAGCHVLYAEDGLYRGGDPTVPQDEPGHPLRHEFTTAIPFQQCNHCHNRGNYDLRTMTFVERDDLPPPEGLSEQARRLHEYYQPIGQFTLCEWELDCIDCHTALEVMGDGGLYDNRAAAQYVQCRTCHGTLDEAPGEMVVESEDSLAMVRAGLNPFVDLEIGATVLMTDHNEAMWHIQREGETWVLTGKVSGTRYEIPPVMGSQCQQQPDQQASHYCHECHAYDRDGPLPTAMPGEE